MSKYYASGENDPILQVFIHHMRDEVRNAIGDMAATYNYEIAVCVMSNAIGGVLGELHAIHKKHAEECEECAKRMPDYHELFLKNFSAAFSQGRNEIESEHAEATAEADYMLAQVLKGHRK